MLPKNYTLTELSVSFVSSVVNFACPFSAPSFVNLLKQEYHDGELHL